MMMEKHSVKGLALVRAQAAAPRILLVRTAPAVHWSLPTTHNGEQLEELIKRIGTELLPNASFTCPEGFQRAFELPEAHIEFHLVTTDAELHPYFESDRFHDARWASFDEAFYIADIGLEPVIRWSERQSRKVLGHS